MYIVDVIFAETSNISVSNSNENSIPNANTSILIFYYNDDD